MDRFQADHEVVVFTMNGLIDAASTLSTSPKSGRGIYSKSLSLHLRGSNLASRTRQSVNAGLTASVPDTLRNKENRNNDSRNSWCLHPRTPSAFKLVFGKQESRIKNFFEFCPINFSRESSRLLRLWRGVLFIGIAQGDDRHS